MTTEHEVAASINISAAEVHISTVEPVSFPIVSQTEMALKDLKEGFLKWRIWFMLAWQDIKLRYRRSVLGPFWLTISMAITVYSMGYLYAHLFHAELNSYYPFLVSGMLGWSLVSSVVLELTEGLTGSDVYIKQVKMPYSLYIHRLAARHMIIFFHNLLVMAPIYIFFHETAKINLYSLLIIPGLIIVYLNGMTFGLVLAMIGARFRDVSQIIKSLVQVVFFVTPVMWTPDILGEKNRFIVDLNPFYSFIELIRAPLLGTTPTVKNLVVVMTATLIGLIFSNFIFTRYRSRIVYWL